MDSIHVGCDHAGFMLKKLLVETLMKMDYVVHDHGTDSTESCDYPLIAHKVCTAIGQSDALGLLICGTGIGMSIAANRHNNIRAALCCTELHAKFARKHNNANILCIGARITGDELALAILKAFLDNHFEGGRHQRRVDEINFSC